MYRQEETEVLLVDQIPEVIHERTLAYAKASEKINDPYLRMLFMNHSIQSEKLYKDLFKGKAAHSLSSNAPIKDWKVWKEMKKAIQAGTRNSILEACIKGEERTIDIFLELLNDKSLSDSRRSLLADQFKLIKQACDQIKIFKICL